eukprot:scaffold163029_cov37-Prasinocladus_malaysianus.AAC.1
MSDGKETSHLHMVQPWLLRAAHMAVRDCIALQASGREPVSWLLLRDLPAPKQIDPIRLVRPAYICVSDVRALHDGGRVPDSWLPHMYLMAVLRRIQEATENICLSRSEVGYVY